MGGNSVIDAQIDLKESNNQFKFDLLTSDYPLVASLKLLGFDEADIHQIRRKSDPNYGVNIPKLSKPTFKYNV